MLRRDRGNSGERKEVEEKRESACSSVPGVLRQERDSEEKEKRKSSEKNVKTTSCGPSGRKKRGRCIQKKRATRCPEKSAAVNPVALKKEERRKGKNYGNQKKTTASSPTCRGSCRSKQ